MSGLFLQSYTTLHTSTLVLRLVKQKSQAISNVRVIALGLLTRPVI